MRVETSRSRVKGSRRRGQAPRSRASTQAGFLAGPGQGSSSRRSFLVSPVHRAEGLGQDSQGGVPVPAGEPATLEVAQAQAGLQLAVIMLDPPSGSSPCGPARRLGVSRQKVRQPVIDQLIGSGQPFGEQPTLQQAAIGRTGNIRFAAPGPVFSQEDDWSSSSIRFVPRRLGALHQVAGAIMSALAMAELAQGPRQDAVTETPGRPQPLQAVVPGTASYGSALVVPLDRDCVRPAADFQFQAEGSLIAVARIEPPPPAARRRQQ